MKPPKSITLDSLDDSLYDKRIKEINELKDENSKLRLENSRMKVADKDWQKRFSDLLAQYKELEAKNNKLVEKLLHYEHEPIIMEICDDGVDVLYWDTETNKYELFASFANNNLEKDLEGFCENFVLELQHTYMEE